LQSNVYFAEIDEPDVKLSAKLMLL